MKKLTLAFMAFALAATTMFTSCSDDDDDDDSSSMAYIEATIDNATFSVTAAAKSSSASESTDATGTSSKLANLFKSSSDRTTIYGVNKAKQFMSITFNGKTTGTYTESISATDIVLSYLSGESVTDALSESVDAFIIYKENSSETTATSDSFWFSTKASVVVSNYMTIGSISYLQGSFTATFMNKSKDTFTISDGVFSCPGI